MRVFLVSQVTKLVLKERLTDKVLLRVAQEVVAGTLRAGEADLGGGLFKKRVARSGSGKSGGHRVVIAYRRPKANRVIFVYAFAKNVSSSLSGNGQEVVANAAADIIAMNDREISEYIAEGLISEVADDE